MRKRRGRDEESTCILALFYKYEEGRDEEAPLMREMEAQISVHNTGRDDSRREGRERALTREKMLLEASLNGNVNMLIELIKEDKLTLVRACLTCLDETPLHIASMLGHVDFAALLLTHKPDMANDLDSRGCSPLHLASANGNVEIVNKLLSVSRDACLIRDEDGRTPLHLAVMKGRVNVVDELVQARPEAILFKLGRGETLLHSCVKHNRLGALKRLVELGRVDELVNVKDDDGNTILHIATALKQMETIIYLTIIYLVSRIGIQVNAVNGNLLTALDIIEQAPRDLKGLEIRESLVNAGTLRGEKISALGRFSINSEQVIIREEEKAAPSKISAPGEKESIASRISSWLFKKQEDWRARSSESLMVAATLIATMAYQAGVNPPGGVWQEDVLNPANTTEVLHYAGKAIMASTRPSTFIPLWRINTLSFVASLSVVLMLVSGIPVNRRIVWWILTLTMWVSITLLGATYWIVVNKLAPDTMRLDKLRRMPNALAITWFGVLVFIFLWHIFRKFRKRANNRFSNFLLANKVEAVALKFYDRGIAHV